MGAHLCKIADLLSLFSLVTLFAHRRMTRPAGTSHQAAWYHKSHPTFADVLALARKEPWACATFRRVSTDTETAQIPIYKPSMEA
jgi:hypothetical protein